MAFSCCFLTLRRCIRGFHASILYQSSFILHHLLKMEPIQCSETSVFNNYKTPGEYPEEFLSSLQHGESLKSRTDYLFIELDVVTRLKPTVLIQFWVDISQKLDQNAKRFQSNLPAHTHINYCSNK